jgi:preprotein translocase subunit SecG
MTTVVLVVHLMIAVSLVGVILLQKSEGGALGMGGGGMSGFMTGRSTANLLTRTTAILAGAFFLTSVTLAYLAGGASTAPPSVTDVPAPSPQSEVPSAPAPAAPSAPAPESVPSAPPPSK